MRIFNSYNDTVSAVDILATKTDKLQSIFSSFEKAFNANMKNLSDHLNSHISFEQHLQETEKQVAKYVEQQLVNSKILQLYVEKELLLSSICNEVCSAQITAIFEAHWWEKITIKQRQKILTQAENNIKKTWEDKIVALEEKLAKTIRETTNK